MSPEIKCGCGGAATSAVILSGGERKIDYVCQDCSSVVGILSPVSVLVEHVSVEEGQVMEVMEDVERQRNVAATMKTVAALKNAWGQKIEERLGR